MSLMTTALAPIFTLSPTVTGPSIFARLCQCTLSPVGPQAEADLAAVAQTDVT
jgi:hypothetical protein